MLCEPELYRSPAYKRFWKKLGRGEFGSAEYKRLGKDGKQVWMQASYNPIFDLDGNPCRVIKFAHDITAMKLRNAEFESRVKAVDLGQAVIEFDVEDNSLDANENFLKVMGYSLRAIKGQHHSMFCTADHVVSEEYRSFWLGLAKGEFISGRFHRIGKFNRDVYVQASYSPITDLKRNVVRVIKYAYDVTEQVRLERSISSKTEEMRGVIGQLAGSIQDITQSSHSATSLASETQANSQQTVSQNVVMLISDLTSSLRH